MLSFRLKLVLLSLADLAMAECENTTLEDTIFLKKYVARHVPREEKVQRQSMFELRATGVVQTYCYSTIGEVE